MLHTANRRVDRGVYAQVFNKRICPFMCQADGHLPCHHRPGPLRDPPCLVQVGVGAIPPAGIGIALPRGRQHALGGHRHPRECCRREWAGAESPCACAACWRGGPARARRRRTPRVRLAGARGNRHARLWAVLAAAAACCATVLSWPWPSWPRVSMLAWGVIMLSLFIRVACVSQLITSPQIHTCCVCISSDT